MLPNYLRAVHHLYDDSWEAVVLLAIVPFSPDGFPRLLYVDSNGNLGTDFIANFNVTAGAWEATR